MEQQQQQQQQQRRQHADLSFIVLCDGPTYPSSWKPQDDRTQWWARRDALTRIAAAALWQRMGTPYPFTSSFVMLFNELHSSSSSPSSSMGSTTRTISALYMYAQGVTRIMPVPTEYAVISACKAAFSCQAASVADINNRRGLSDVFHSLPAYDNSVHCCRDVSCVVDSSIALMASEAKGAKVFGGGNGSKRYSGVACASHAMDKREMLRAMQTTQDMDFLRKHGLTGSEALVLKKKNAGAIRAAYDAWRNGTQTQQKDLSAPSLAGSAAVEGGQNKGIENQLDEERSADDKLLRAMKTVLEKCMKSTANANSATSTAHVSAVSCSGGGIHDGDSSRSETVLLLLHEDYKAELPVFGDEEGGGCGNWTGGGGGDCSRPMRLICVLGAVRDCSTTEEQALLRAASALGIKAVGANLGRTAEFTSKIITALNAHNVSGRLAQAVRRLPAIDIHATSDDLPDQQQSGALQKLPPVRGWTWDGHGHNSFSSSSSGLLAAASTATTIGHQTENHHIIRSASGSDDGTTTFLQKENLITSIAPDTLSLVTAKSACCSVDDSTKVGSGAGTSSISQGTGTIKARTQHTLHFAVWLDAEPRDLSDSFEQAAVFSGRSAGASVVTSNRSITSTTGITGHRHGGGGGGNSNNQFCRSSESNSGFMSQHTTAEASASEGSQRQRMYEVVQLVVNTLWRSRIVSEAAAGGGATGSCYKGHADNEGDGSGNGNGDISCTRDDRPEAAGLAAPPPAVLPVLFLVFRNGAVARLTQHAMGAAMAERHMAVPSEFQILHMLSALLKMPATFVAGGASTVGGSRSSSRNLATNNSTSMNKEGLLAADTSLSAAALLGHLLPSGKAQSLFVS